MTKIPIIIDTDPGMDDAVAISIALNDSRLDVRLITTVAGNSNLKNVTHNTLKLMAFHEKEIPVAMGASEPLIAPSLNAQNIHGKSGLDGYEFVKSSDHLLLPIHAIAAMKEVIMKSDEPITLVPIGPLTNIALLLKVYPQVQSKIKQIVLMGGTIARGNIGVYREFNIACDPEAAKIVFNSKVPLVMIGLDIGRKALIHKDMMEYIKNLNKTGHMVYQLFNHERKDQIDQGLKMYDVCAIAYLLEPSMYEVNTACVDIELNGTHTYGASIVDFSKRRQSEQNCLVCTDINVKQFTSWFKTGLQKCK